MLVIYYDTWNSSSPLPLHDCQQMDTITADKAYIYQINPPTAIHHMQNTAH